MKKAVFLSSILLFVSYISVMANPILQTAVPVPEEISGEWRYSVTDGAATITGYTGNKTEITIPADFNQIPVITIGEAVFRDHTEIEQVTLPDSVLTIGKAAFSGCTSLKQVKLPLGLTKIINEAFRYCTALESIEFPQTLTVIYSSAFEGCSSLNNVVLPDSITNVGANAFKDCSVLSSMTISKNLRSLSGNAFAGTPWLAAQTDEFVMIGNKILLKYNGTSGIVEVPVTVTSIVDAFANNVNIEEVILPNTVTSIGDYAFSGCINLETVILPVSVTSITEYVFKDCRSLQKIEIPEKVTYVGNGVFQGCSQIKQILLPNGIKSIGYRTFAECSALELVSVPATVETINKAAFEASPSINLKVVYGTIGEEFAKTNEIPYTWLVQKTADFSFLRSENGAELLSYIGQIYDVNVPENLEGTAVWKIGPGAFQESVLTRSVSLPESVKEIGDWSFSYMDELKSVNISDGTDKIGANAFTGSKKLSEIYIPSSVTEIGSEAFKDCPNLTIQAVSGSFAWEEASRLGIKVTDPLMVSGDFRLSAEDGIYMLIEYTGTEKNLTLLTDVIGRKITKVGEKVFSYGSLDEIRIPEGYLSIGKQAFGYMMIPLIITLPDSLTEIAADAFEGTDITFRAHTGTVAEQYAREHGIKFLVLHD
jgi:hypothetical protein